MEINERSMGTVTVLDLSGKLVWDGAQRHKDKVNSLVFQGRTQIVLNLGEVSQIDSTGLGEIVACLTTVTRRGGRQAVERGQTQPGPAVNHPVGDGLRDVRLRGRSGAQLRRHNGRVTRPHRGSHDA